MQASIYLPSSSLPFLSTKTSTFTKTLLFPVKHDHQQCIIKSSTSISMIKATASDAPEVDYGSMQSSVFPAEACETLGGVACDAEMFPETKLKQEPKSNNKVTAQTVDREYLQVFISEACDDL
ncbi:light-regulated protein 1, chloroplastic-like [Bidens hawaiensis]|uniref:light-regulated protein 1, chloroplastic-like n=1 Tax=Bidens hawaiensis TaxID=980011 RepID=UPI0040494321